MKTKRVQKLFVSTVTLIILLMGTDLSLAQEWPSKPITIIHPWAAGGASDLITRAFAEGLEKRLKVPIIVDNKPGGSGLIGAAYAANAKPDGYTLLFLSCSAITEKSVILKIPFDIVHAYSFIAQIYDYSYSFAVKTDKPWKTFPDFVEAAKKQPGKLTVSSSGTGSTMHVALVKLEAKIPEFKTTHVPYKSTVMAAAAAAGGHVDAAFVLGEAVPFLEAGTIRLLAVPAKKRWAKYPDVPTWLDLGYGVYAESPGAFVAPAGLPEKIRARLEEEVKAVSEFPNVKETINKFHQIGIFKPGQELYKELIAMYEENKKILPQYFPAPK